jgi:hypothetical protein
MTTEQKKSAQLNHAQEQKNPKHRSTQLEDAELEKVAGGLRGAGDDDDLKDLEIQR